MLVRCVLCRIVGSCIGVFSLRPIVCAVRILVFVVVGGGVQCVVAGRSRSCDVIINDSRISSVHCRIYKGVEVEDGVHEMVIEDTSSNGTDVKRMEQVCSSPVVAGRVGKQLRANERRHGQHNASRLLHPDCGDGVGGALIVRFSSLAAPPLRFCLSTASKVACGGRGLCALKRIPSH